MATGYFSVDKCVPGPGVNIDIGQPMYQSCSCQDGCGLSCSCIVNRGCAYQFNGKLKDVYLLEPSPPIFECNTGCMCLQCVNKVTQSTFEHVIVKKASEQKGMGVFAIKDISCGTFVGEYIGEVIRQTTAEERMMTAYDNCYLVIYREHLESGDVVTTCIDAQFYGNYTRFINHSCSPNLKLLPVRRDSILPHLCLFTITDIKVGQELTFRYSDNTHNNSLSHKSCYCGSSNCIRFLPHTTTS